MDKKTLTVGEVIKLLQALPSDWPVWIEGCDCVGPATDVNIHKVYADALDDTMIPVVGIDRLNENW